MFTFMGGNLTRSGVEYQISCQRDTVESAFLIPENSLGQFSLI